MAYRGKKRSVSWSWGGTSWWHLLLRICLHSYGPLSWLLRETHPGLGWTNWWTLCRYLRRQSLKWFYVIDFPLKGYQDFHILHFEKDQENSFHTIWFGLIFLSYRNGIRKNASLVALKLRKNEKITFLFLVKLNSRYSEIFCTKHHLKKTLT